jgi:hypothetical protein
VYVIAVAGSKMYEITQRHEPLMAKLAAGLSTYQVITVARDTLSYESHRIDGGLVDRFTLTKAGLAPSVYQNRAP